jgi:hypothetical protein
MIRANKQPYYGSTIIRIKISVLIPIWDLVVLLGIRCAIHSTYIHRFFTLAPHQRTFWAVPVFSLRHRLVPDHTTWQPCPHWQELPNHQDAAFLLRVLQAVPHIYSEPGRETHLLLKSVIAAGSFLTPFYYGNLHGYRTSRLFTLYST